MTKTATASPFFKLFAAAALAGLGLFAAPAQASATNTQIDAMATPIALFAAAQLEGELNLNEASATQLEMLPGVGPVTAQRIVDYRAKRPFADPLHLMRVKGVGRKTYNKVKPFLRVDGPTTLHVVK